MTYTELRQWLAALAASHAATLILGAVVGFVVAEILV